MKRIIAWVIAVLFAVPALAVVPVFQLTAYASLETLPQKERNLTNEEFLGIWDAEANDGEGAWTVAPHINYSYSEGLAPVEEAVKAGDYDNAAVLLLNYYKETGRVFRFPSTRRNSANNSATELFCDNIYPRGTMQTSQTITNEEQWYSFELTDVIKTKLSTGVTRASYTFMGRYKSPTTATFYSKEAGEEFRPVLAITVDGEERLYPVTADTYIRAGSHGNEIYGGEDRLYVRETGMPVDDDTMRMYLQFDFPDLSASSRIQSAEIRVYGSIDSDEPMKLIAFNSEQLEVREDSQTWMTTGVNFFSWQGAETAGPTEWTVPQGSGYDYMSPLNRFWTPMGVLGVYEQTGDEVYAQKLIEYTANFYEGSGAGALLLPAEDRPTDTNLGAGNRLQMVVDMYWSLLKSPSFDEEDNLVFLKLIYDDIEFLNLPECFWGHHASGNNWGSQSNAGIATGLAYFPEFDKTEEWLDELAKRVSHQLDTLIQDDGSYIEATNSYSVGVFGDFVKYKALMTDIGYPIPSTLDQRLKRFVYSFMNGMEPNGNLTEYGDDGYDFDQELLDQMYDLGLAYGDDDILYVASRGEEKQAPDHTSVDYPNGKYTIMRTGWGENDLFSFIITRPFATHSHNHSMSMTVYAYGRRLLADTSQRSYDSETISNWQRLGRRSHNVIEMNDSTVYTGWTDNTGYIKANSDNTIAPSFDIFDGFHRENDPDGLGDFAEMQRRVTFVKPLKYWIVSDYAEAQNDEVVGENKYNQVWHMEPRANVRMASDTKKFYSNYAGGANLQVVPADPEELEATIATDGYMGTSNHRYASYVKHSEGPVTYDTLLLPTQENSGVSGSVERIDMDVPTTTASAIRIRITENGSLTGQGDYYTSHEETPTLRTFGINETDAKIAFVNTDKNDSLNFALINEGTRLANKGMDLIAAGSVVHDLSVEWQGSTLQLTSSAQRVTDMGTVRVYAPNQTAVTFNGRTVDYQRDSSYIVLNPTALRIASASSNTGSVGRFEQHFAVRAGDTIREATVSNTTDGNAYTTEQALPRTFAVEQGMQNVASSATVTVPSKTQDAGRLTDGKYNASWDADSADYPQRIELDLGEVYDVSDVAISWGKHPTGMGKYRYQISYSTDGKTYESLKEQINSGETVDNIYSKARYIRLDVLENTFYSPVSILEIKVHSVGNAEVDDAWKSVLTVGQQDGTLAQPVRIELKGMADKKVGLLASDGSVTPINSMLSSDSADALGNAASGRYNSGEDAVIWSHATGNFIVYGTYDKDDESELDPGEGGGRPGDPTVKPPVGPPSGGGGSSSGGGGGGGGGGTTVIPTPTPTPTPTPAPAESAPFADVDGHWAQAEITQMVEQGVIKGMTEDSFAPDRDITRAEFTALIVRAFGLGTAEYREAFADVTGDAWYGGELQAAFDAGLVSGSDGQFRPDDPVSREEAIKILVGAVEKTSGAVQPAQTDFADSADVSGWAVPYVGKAVALGMVQGDESNNLNPHDTATRAQAAVMIARVLDS